MLQANAEVVADVGRGNPFSVEGLQDETRVLAPVVPHHDTKEWSETLSLSSLGLKGPIRAVMPETPFAAKTAR
jgi:hypothetical protein